LWLLTAFDGVLNGALVALATVARLDGGDVDGRDSRNGDDDVEDLHVLDALVLENFYKF
jgi:hypothetical protein